jgi:multisubunit Na+/H+ antiporter MnhF subunit
MIRGGIPDKTKVSRYYQIEEPEDMDMRLFNIGLIYIICTFILVFNINTNETFYKQNIAVILSTVTMLSVLIALILKLLTDNKIYTDVKE